MERITDANISLIPTIMKRLFFILLLLIGTSLHLYAQESVQEEQTPSYLTFKGMELKPGLTMSELYSFLKKKGLKENQYNDYFYETSGMYILEGMFQNIPNCRFTIMPTTTDPTVVGKIGVSFPNRDTFAQLWRDYDNIKSGLLNKYFLYDSEEKFYDQYVEESTSDYLKIRALKNDECRFRSEFYPIDSELGLIFGRAILTISHICVDYVDSYYVSLSYCTPNDTMDQLKNMDDL